jgi:quercetin dioxygenase-like cupin family protein
MAKANYAVPPQYYSRYFETFFCSKGRINMWANSEKWQLSPHDFAAMPVNHNRSF